MPTSEWRRLLPAVGFHRVASTTHVALRENSLVPATILDRLAALHGRSFGRHLLMTAVLERVSRTLDEAGVPHVAIKGPVLAELVYPRPDLREYGDLDLLVPPSAFAAALETLEAGGATLIEQNWQLMHDIGKGELNLVTPRRGRARPALEHRLRQVAKALVRD